MFDQRIKEASFSYEERAHLIPARHLLLLGDLPRPIVPLLGLMESKSSDSMIYLGMVDVVGVVVFGCCV